MALDPQRMKHKFKQAIIKGLKQQYPDVSGAADYQTKSLEEWTRMADAISEIAIELVKEITSSADVVPGQQVRVGSDAGTTISKGRIV